MMCNAQQSNKICILGMDVTCFGFCDELFWASSVMQIMQVMQPCAQAILQSTHGVNDVFE